MDDNNKLAELADSVASLREDVKRAEDTLRGVDSRFRSFELYSSNDIHGMDRLRSRMIDIDDKVTKHDERFDRIDEALQRIIDKVGY